MPCCPQFMLMWETTTTTQITMAKTLRAMVVSNCNIHKLLVSNTLLNWYESGCGKYENSMFTLYWDHSLFYFSLKVPPSSIIWTTCIDSVSERNSNVSQAYFYTTMVWMYLMGFCVLIWIRFVTSCQNVFLMVCWMNNVNWWFCLPVSQWLVILLLGETGGNERIWYLEYGIY